MAGAATELLCEEISAFFRVSGSLEWHFTVTSASLADGLTDMCFKATENGCYGQVLISHCLRLSQR